MNKTKQQSVASVSAAAQNATTHRTAPRWLQVLNLLIFLAAVAAIIIALNFFAMRPAYRAQIDATKTRAYSLSEQSRQLLAGLQGQWTIAMVVSEAGVDRSMRKQIDEVLRRYTDASSNIRVLKIDPDNPRTLREYESLLQSLNALYKDDIAKYDAALDTAVAAFKDFQIFAQQHAVEVATGAQATPEQDPSHKRLEQSAGLFGLVAEQGQKVLDTVIAMRRVDETRPVADYDGARSTLATSLTQWSNECDAVAQIFRAWLQRPNIDAGAKAFAQAAVDNFNGMASRLAAGADPLRQLPPLDLSEIGHQLGEGEAAVILSPDRATVIPSRQLFPKSNLQPTSGGGISFDQRFRGEQLISAAIRSLTIEQMPRVVFVHAEADPPMLRPRPNNADLIGAAGMLKASRYDVAEWNVVKSPARPEPVHRGQRTVWVIVPPAPAGSIEAPPSVRALYEATDKLLADGECVLLSVYFSLLSKYGQPDPFAMLAAPFGIRPETGTIILEQQPVAHGESEAIRAQAVQDFSEETAIGRAVDGQQARFDVPVPLRRIEGDLGGTLAGVNSTIHTIAVIEPRPTLWLETDWTTNFNERDPKPEQRVTEPIPIALTAERDNPMGGDRQRLIVIGSGGWMITNVANQVVTIGGNREALVNPGNHELLLASVAWLAGQDDLIAASPLSQEVSRLRGITPEISAAWWWIIVAGVPAACVLLGAGVWLWRRM